MLGKTCSEMLAHADRGSEPPSDDREWIPALGPVPVGPDTVQSYGPNDQSVSTKRSIHTGKLPQQHEFANASCVVLFRVTLCHPTMWTVQQLMFCVETVISVKLLGY